MIIDEVHVAPQERILGRAGWQGVIRGECGKRQALECYQRATEIILQADCAGSAPR